jgi:hypothetical protein
VLVEYVEYYNATRPHRTLELETPEGPRPRQREGRMVAHPVLGGIHHRYERRAARPDLVLWPDILQAGRRPRAAAARAAAADIGGDSNMSTRLLR